MGNVHGIATGKRNPCGQLRKLGESLDYRFSFDERGDGFEGYEIGIGIRQCGKTLCVEGDQFVTIDVVLAVVLSSIVKSRTIRPQRSGDPDTAWVLASVLGARLLGNAYRLHEGATGCRYGFLRSQTEVTIAHSRNLIACRRDAVRSGPQIIEVYCGQSSGRAIEPMC